LRTAYTLLAIVAFWAEPGAAQEADYGISVPVTLSGGALYTHRLQLSEPDASPTAAAFRVMIYPTIKLGPHWFGYAAVQVRSNPYFYYDAFYTGREIYVSTVQAFAGYASHVGETSVMFKAGRLSSAFGSFPLRYDDAQNPLLDQPLSYIQRTSLRGDQLVCGTADLRRQRYGLVDAGCGGVKGSDSSLTPVSLYGLPGIQAEVSGRRMDARLQFTNGSPANPRGWQTPGRYLQWTAGAGYTIRQGFRIGVSGFSGPYLDSALTPFLPSGSTIRDYPAKAIGLDGQWARGRWSVNAEWQRFQFGSPNFVMPPRVTSSYAEAKMVMTPRLYLAGRAGRFSSGQVMDRNGISAPEFAATLTSLELGGGVWLNRRQLLKVSYGWLNIEGQAGTRMNVLGLQFVTTLHPLNWAFR
jgi:hypothetical protein